MLLGMPIYLQASQASLQAGGEHGVNPCTSAICLNLELDELGWWRRPIHEHSKPIQVL